MQEIKSVDVISLAKIKAIFGIVVGLICGIVFAIIGGGIGFAKGLPGVEVFGILLIVMFPIILAICGLIGGAITALLYNFLPTSTGAYRSISSRNNPPYLFFPFFSPLPSPLSSHMPSLPVMKNRTSLLVTLCLITAVWVCGCTSQQSPAVPSLSPAATTFALAQAPATVPGGFALRVDALAPGSTLPDVYTCKGASESPELSWENVPQKTKSLVLILDDPDAPQGTFTHWILYNIPANVRRIDRAQPNAKVLANGAQQGDSSAGSRGYYPPCPPIGPAHRYIFSLYALDYEVSMPTAGRDSIDWAMGEHILGQATVITTFKR